MEAAAKAFGYDNLQIKSPYPLVSLTELKIINQPNEHSTLYYTGIIPEGMVGSYIEKAKAGDAVAVVQTADGAEGMTLFSGQVCQIKTKNSQGVAYLEVEAISWTFDLDVKVRSRSFQNQKLRYTELMQQVLADYPGAAFRGPQFKDDPINRLIVQYLETDWQFLIRVASQTGAVLIPDVTQNTKPHFWLGLPEGRAAEIKAVEYGVMRDLEGYAEANANYNISVNESAFTGYTVTSRQYFNLGDRVIFQGKNLRVARSSAIMRDSILQFEYILMPESGIRQNPLLNPKLSGASIEGKIIDRAKDTVKVHLAIDPTQPKERACWLPYSSFYTAEGNSGWYCMPELGDSIKLYFPEAREDQAVVNSSVRKGGQSDEKMANPNVKYLGNSSGKELMLGENAVTFTAGSKNGQLVLKLDQGQGVEVQSDQELLIYSDKDLQMEVEQKLAIQAQDGIYLSCNSSSIILDGETDIQGTQVAIEGVGPPPVVQPSDPAPEAEQDAAENDNSETILDAIQLGLDVVGLIPVVGSFADIANAGIS
ncbi:MAG TPA: contractile injection system protein, VgrG/Pvc8 family, partial [Bacillota bacterium]|nr:contractile injection system protein, VgrG/Pvc8 family [Bacillota bacterium]